MFPDDRFGILTQRRNGSFAPIAEIGPCALLQFVFTFAEGPLIRSRSCSCGVRSRRGLRRIGRLDAPSATNKPEKISERINKDYGAEHWQKKHTCHRKKKDDRQERSYHGAMIGTFARYYRIDGQKDDRSAKDKRRPYRLLKIPGSERPPLDVVFGNEAKEYGN